MAVGKTGYPGAEVARFLGVTTSAVVRAAKTEEPKRFKSTCKFIQKQPLVHDRYRWSEHSVLVGCRRRIWQDLVEILSLFGLRKREAMRRYREFIEDGFNMGRREDLTGGGLRRSAAPFQGSPLMESLGGGLFYPCFLTQTKEQENLIIRHSIFMSQ